MSRNKSKNKVSVSDPKTKERMITSSDHDEADILNTYFSRVFTKENNTNIASFDPIVNLLKMMDIIVTDDIFSKHHSLNKSKSPDQIVSTLIC